MGSKVRESRLKAAVKKMMPFGMQKFIYKNIVRKARNLKLKSQKKIIKESIKKELIKIGLKKGDAVIVHSSLSRIGFIEDGADSLIDAFLEVVGEDGLLVMPAFSALNYDESKKIYIFDVKNTPAYAGAVPETFRKRKWVFRSISPTHSLIAYGKKAKWFTEGQEKCDNPYGKEGPFYKLLELDAKIFLIGVDQLANSSIHIVEDKYKDFPIKVWTEKSKVLVIYPDGSRKIIYARWHIPNLYKKRDNNMLEKPFLEEKLMRIYPFFNTEVRVIRVKDVADCMERLAKKKITIYNPEAYKST
ncbi:AAC(3) family N-acetyltransferase [Candidatus Woesearchaeota archaeon]|nr:AAC(3) family N-acetyltransferase [Candidatus Woesearchaeota archaeon]